MWAGWRKTGGAAPLLLLSPGGHLLFSTSVFMGRAVRGQAWSCRLWQQLDETSSPECLYRAVLATLPAESARWQHYSCHRTRHSRTGVCFFPRTSVGPSQHAAHDHRRLWISRSVWSARVSRLSSNPTSLPSCSGQQQQRNRRGRACRRAALGLSVSTSLLTTRAAAQLFSTCC